MALYCYIKVPPGKGRFFIKKYVFFTQVKKISPFFLVCCGLSLVFFVSYSFFSYQVLVFKKSRKRIVAPISELAMAEAQGFVNPLVAGAFTQKSKDPNQQGEEIDYNLITNWFPTAVIPPVTPSKITHYTLAIPKLKINEAVVEVGGIEVKKTLVQYPGTAFPGEFGNVVIFGHSVLPAFYNPKDYKTIFSTIPTLEKGDQILVSSDGIEFIYEVVFYKEVKPEDIDILEQRFDQQTLSLVTCVPPGTYLRRGIIIARLFNPAI
ncbi:MAG TPA: sortase [Candidatus Bathyarchaeia archaeon]|nr:sortase [Candidatus Bathyarchaeia archaeon]